MVKEREAGTVEQLLMTPAGTGEIIIAKIAPLFLLLCGMVLFATALSSSCSMCPFGATCCWCWRARPVRPVRDRDRHLHRDFHASRAQQAQLMSFFVNPPLSTLSGALTPVEAMPHWMQPLTLLNPLRHFGVITRAVLLKGSGIDILWPNFLALLAFTLITVTLSVRRFRRQLG